MPSLTQTSDRESPRDLQQIHSEIWHQLHLAVNDPSHGWHLPVLGTENDGFPELRTVVLRDVVADRLELICHTDRRSSKIASLEKNDKTAWLFYDAGLRIQLRIASTARLHFENETAETQWQRTRPESRRCYAATYRPGLKSSQPDVNLPESLREGRLDESALEIGRKHFAVIVGAVQSIDWLLLNSNGNLAARFEYDRTTLVDSSWILP